MAKTGQKLAHAEALELLAAMHGFSTYRAMAAESKAQAAKAPVEGEDAVALDRTMHDWLFAEEPANEECTPERQRPYTVRVENYLSGVQVLVMPEGVAEDDFPGKPVLSLHLEINGGVPAVSLSNDTQENLLTVFSTGEGLFVREDTDIGWANRTYAPEGSDLARVVKNHGDYAEGALILRDTAAIYAVPRSD
ncbi:MULTISPECIES: hypothetical protein [unclassified Variovorax]|uniref:hypothetical protein n=1 Tax=unclassified Variovorax TaxID=663243 RepID=UPI0011AEE0AE|nr:MULTISPECIES: hypothetical protein [unclassified Variovorax]